MGFFFPVDRFSRRNIPLYTYMLLRPVFYIHAPSVRRFSVPSTVHEIRSQTNRENRRVINLRIINCNTNVLNRRIFFIISLEEKVYYVLWNFIIWSRTMAKYSRWQFFSLKQLSHTWKEYRATVSIISN